MPGNDSADQRPRAQRSGFGKVTRAFAAVLLSSIAYAPFECAAASPHAEAHHSGRHVSRLSVRPIRHGRIVSRHRAMVRVTRSTQVPRSIVRPINPPPSLINTTWDNPKVSPAVVDAIRTAAQQSEIDPSLLEAIAWRESRFDPAARNHQSSAEGLVQFTAGTWFQAIHDYGAVNGFPDSAAVIQRDRTGALQVADRSVRAAILDRRADPYLSARMAAEGMRRQRESMQARIGRSVGPADLYLLHVLGTSGCTRFLTALSRHPNASILTVADYRVLNNAGLLGAGHRPLSLQQTYAAIGTMLIAQRVRTEQATTPLHTADAGVAVPVEVSAGP